MTQLIQDRGRTYHQCAECKLFYEKKKLAEECEAWCREHKTCNIEITKHAVTAAASNQAQNKQEKKITKRDERLAERARAERKRKFAKFAKRSEIISQSGLHWHPELTISVKGVKQEMPANLGIGGLFMVPVHTHEPNGVIHLEFQGLVRKSDITLGRFFTVWGKDIRSFGAHMNMTVNGKENTEYENYRMQDKDKIELRYE